MPLFSSDVRSSARPAFNVSFTSELATCIITLIVLPSLSSFTATFPRFSGFKEMLTSVFCEAFGTTIFSVICLIISDSFALAETSAAFSKTGALTGFAVSISYLIFAATLSTTHLASSFILTSTSCLVMPGINLYSGFIFASLAAISGLFDTGACTASCGNFTAGCVSTAGADFTLIKFSAAG
ncbi:MAG: hypothetical protein BWY84_00388 [Candidatus Aerophobetes bacterium ADurb.Bin490]|nr:MAG: hypothetical protein BWY84_00388 [Candidatus Aerophobetes bacterium ADurb.Bin490]